MAMSYLIKYGSIYSEKTGSFWSSSKYDATNFDNDTANTDVLKYSKYRSKLFGDTAVQTYPNQAKVNLENTAIAVPSNI